MPFSTRNALYLRISSWTVLPLYLYLDERHVHWMTDQILQAVLADLRPKLAAKFREEQPSKKSTVEVHRGGSYQFAFFFRKTDARHVVLLKKRQYHLQPTAPAVTESSATPAPDSRKRKRGTASSATPAPRDGRTPSVTPQLPSRTARQESLQPRRSARASSRVSYAEGDGEDEFDDGLDEGALAEVAAAAEAFDRPVDDAGDEGEPELEAIVKDEPEDEDAYRPLPPQEGLQPMQQDEEEDDLEDEKKDFKPVLKLSYTGFSISSRQLVLIVEPWPPLPTSTPRASRPRSTFSRSMSRELGDGRSSTIASSVDGDDDRSTTPLVPNSRRGGTGSVAWSATPGIPNADRRSATPLVPNSRAGGSAAGTPALGDMGPPQAIRRATPLFRDATPFSDAGDSPAGVEEGDDEDDLWRKRARSASWAPWRGESAEPGRGETPARDMDDDDEMMGEARGMLAMSQSLQENTAGRAGSVALGGRVGDMDEGDEEGDEGAVGDEVGGAD